MGAHRFLGVSLLLLYALAASAYTQDTKRSALDLAQTSAIATAASSKPAATRTAARPRTAPSSTSSTNLAAVNTPQINPSTKHGQTAAAPDRRRQSSDRAATRGPAKSSNHASSTAVDAQQLLPNPPNIITASGGERMRRFSRDIRGLQLGISAGQVNVLAVAPQSTAAVADVTAFTFRGDLTCAGSTAAVRIGTCSLSADLLLPATNLGIYQAQTTAICVMDAAAPSCDPQFSSGLTITATGILIVNTNSGSQQPTPAVNQFATAAPLIVDGIYSSTRPDTLLSGLIGFKTGNIIIPSVIRNAVTNQYTGSLFLNLYKGGPLS